MPNTARQQQYQSLGCVVGLRDRYEQFVLRRIAVFDELSCQHQEGRINRKDSAHQGATVDMERTQLDREQSIRKELEQAKRLAHGSINMGRDTIEALDVQEEKLRAIEDTLEANEHVLAKSMKTMQGMTWSGYLYNHCVNTKELVMSALPPAAPLAPPRKSPPQAAISANRNDLIPSQAAMRSGSIEQDKDLDEISSAVAVLHKMSVDIGNQLDNQSATIDGITEKTEKVTEKTLAVTLRASQMSDRSRQRKPTHVGVVQLVDTRSGKFLAAVDDRLVLSEKADRSTCFSCFVKESHLFGLRNEKTLKYVGCAMLGHIIVESAYFGTQEECYIDLSATADTTNSTGILFIARHWGAGAWLKWPAADLSKPGCEENNGPPAPPYLTETTAGIADKAERIEFRVIKLAPVDKTKS
jgi:hypothetical protein